MTSGISKIIDLFGCLEVFVKAIATETVFTEAFILWPFLRKPRNWSDSSHVSTGVIQSGNPCKRYTPGSTNIAGWNMDPD